MGDLGKTLPEDEVQGMRGRVTVSAHPREAALLFQEVRRLVRPSAPVAVLALYPLEMLHRLLERVAAGLCPTDAVTPDALGISFLSVLEKGFVRVRVTGE